jgi:hypothetical protein
MIPAIGFTVTLFAALAAIAWWATHTDFSK